MAPHWLRKDASSPVYPASSTTGVVQGSFASSRERTRSLGIIVQLQTVTMMMLSSNNTFLFNGS